MRDFFDSFWRALAYCLHPRVWLWAMLPLAAAGGLVGLLGWAYWEDTVGAVRSTLEQGLLVARMLQWLDSIGAQHLRALLAPLIVVSLSVPLVVVLTLLLVAFVVTPAAVRMVAARRFPDLQRRDGAAWWMSVLWPLACTAAALLALVLSVPLWFVPPLVLVLPPLIWGWLTYRVMAFDALSLHATARERHQVMHGRRWPLRCIGLCCGYLGAVPGLVWAASAATLIFAPLLAIVSVWLYTIVFAFASCWFAHFVLAELQRLRAAEAAAEALPNILGS